MALAIVASMSLIVGVANTSYTLARYLHNKYQVRRANLLRTADERILLRELSMNRQTDGEGSSVISMYAKVDFMSTRIGARFPETTWKMLSNYFDPEFNNSEANIASLKDFGFMYLPDHSLQKHTVIWSIILSELVGEARKVGLNSSEEKVYRHFCKAAAFLDVILHFKDDNPRMEASAKKTAEFYELNFEDALMITLMASIRITSRVDTTLEAGILTIYNTELERGEIEDVEVDGEYDALTQNTAFQAIVDKFMAIQNEYSFTYSGILGVFKNGEVPTLARIVDTYTADENVIQKDKKVHLQEVLSLSESAGGDAQRRVLVGKNCVVAADSKGNIVDALPGEAKRHYKGSMINSKVQYKGTFSSHSIAARSRIVIGSEVHDILVDYLTKEHQRHLEQHNDKLDKRPWASSEDVLVDTNGFSTYDVTLMADAAMFYNTRIVHAKDNLGAFKCVSEILKAQPRGDESLAIMINTPHELILTINSHRVIFGTGKKLELDEEHGVYHLTDAASEEAVGKYERRRMVLG